MTKHSSIASVDITTIALPAIGARLHSDGKEPLLQVRHIIKIKTNDGITGLGDIGPRVTKNQLVNFGAGIIGEDVFQLDRIQRKIRSAKFYRMDLAIASAGFEMACLDIIGQIIERPMGSLLGGTSRDYISLIGYLYRREAGADSAPIKTSEDVVSAAESMNRTYGFETWKLKAGANEVTTDIETMQMLRDKFPNHKLRIDPNGAWAQTTAITAARHLMPLDLEWVEDPVLGIEAMATFNQRTTIPTATNMCCIEPSQFPAAVRLHAMDVMLLDLWYLGGPWSARLMASTCQSFGLEVGIHAGGGSPETGIGLAAELHLASAIPALTHASDTAYFELAEDIIEGPRFHPQNGRLRVPEGTGLGVTLDEDALARAAERYSKNHEILEASSRIFPPYPLF